MKTTINGLKLIVHSPNADIDVQFHMEQVTFEANTGELLDMYRHSIDTLVIIGDQALRILDKIK